MSTTRNAGGVHDGETTNAATPLGSAIAGEGDPLATLRENHRSAVRTEIFEELSRRTKIPSEEQVRPNMSLSYVKLLSERAKRMTPHLAPSPPMSTPLHSLPKLDASRLVPSGFPLLDWFQIAPFGGGAPIYEQRTDGPVPNTVWPPNPSWGEDPYPRKTALVVPETGAISLACAGGTLDSTMSIPFDSDWNWGLGEGTYVSASIEQSSPGFAPFAALATHFTVTTELVAPSVQGYWGGQVVLAPGDPTSIGVGMVAAMGWYEITLYFYGPNGWPIGGKQWQRTKFLEIEENYDQQRWSGGGSPSAFYAPRQQLTVGGDVPAGATNALVYVTASLACLRPGFVNPDGGFVAILMQDTFKTHLVAPEWFITPFPILVNWIKGTLTAR